MRTYLPLHTYPRVYLLSAYAYPLHTYPTVDDQIKEIHTIKRNILSSKAKMLHFRKAISRYCRAQALAASPVFMACGCCACVLAAFSVRRGGASAFGAASWCVFHAGLTQSS